jgi:hypothetical protein
LNLPRSVTLKQVLNLIQDLTISGSQMALFYEMLNQVQHDTGKRNLFLKKQINIKNSNKISGTFENVRPIWTAVFLNLSLSLNL